MLRNKLRKDQTACLTLLSRIREGHLERGEWSGHSIGNSPASPPQAVDLVLSEFMSIFDFLKLDIKFGQACLNPEDKGTYGLPFWLFLQSPTNTRLSPSCLSQVAVRKRLS